MATSGKITTNTEYDSYFWVRWEMLGQDIQNNQTAIRWYCGVTCGHNFQNNAIRMDPFTIDGRSVYGGGTYSNFATGEHQIATGDLWIGHDTDGTKTFIISKITGWLYLNHHYEAAEGSFSLPQILGTATITEASDFVDTEGTPSITVDNPGGLPILYAWIEPIADGAQTGEHLCKRENILSENNYKGDFKWELKEEELDALRQVCQGKSCTIRYGIYYYVGSSLVASCLDRIFSLDEETARPVVEIAKLEPDNTSLPEAFAGMYIQGKTKLTIEANAKSRHHAEIVGLWAEIEGKTYTLPATTNVLQGSGGIDVRVWAQDSRGFTGEDYATIYNVLEYSKPLVIPLEGEKTVQCYRSYGNGKRVGNSTSVWIKAKRSYCELGGKNTCSLQWRRKLVSEEWKDDWVDLVTIGEYNGLLPGVVFNLKEAYAVQIRAIDTIGEFDIKTFEIPTQDVALHLGKGGKNVTIGTYCDYSEDHTFRSAWKTIFEDEVMIGDQTLKEYIKSVINEGG